MLKLLILPLICALAGMAQGLPQIAEGDWTFHVNGTADFSIRITRSSDVTFSGAYAGTPVLTGKSVSSSTGLNMTLSWIYGSSNIPGSNLTWFGTLAPDGRSISGTYGLSPSQSAGSWSAKLTAPAVPPTTSGCDAKSLNAAYSFLLTGAVQTDAGSITVHILGRVAMDGGGGLIGAEYATAGGAILSHTLTGKYDVSPDCIATIQVADEIGRQSNFKAVLSAAGKTLQLIEIDSGTVVSGTAYQQ